MSANHSPAPAMPGRLIIGALDEVRRHFGFTKLIDVLTASGMNEATAYRRLKNPAALSLGEISAVAEHFGVPLQVLAAGDLATLRFLKERGGSGPFPPSGPGGSGDEGDPSTIWYPKVIEHPTFKRATAA